MKTLTQKESEALLLLFKDFSKNYNANSISSVLEITPRGALKILKGLKERNMLISKTFGKAVFYKINFKDNHTAKAVETLLMQEAKENASRWVSEFRELFEFAEVVILFGSSVRTPKKANDLDILIVVSQKNLDMVEEFVKTKNKILLNPIHPIYQSPNDIKNNLQKKQAVVINALRLGYILHGYEKIMEAVKNATSFE